MAILSMGAQFEESDGEVKFPVAEPGVYEARIVGVVDHGTGNKSKHPGTPMWKITFQLDEGEHKGMKINNYQMLPYGDGTEWMEDSERERHIDEIKRLWMATGAPSNGGEVDSDDLLHMQCRIEVGKRADDNDPEKFFNDVNDILSI